MVIEFVWNPAAGFHLSGSRGGNAGNPPRRPWADLTDHARRRLNHFRSNVLFRYSRQTIGFTTLGFSEVLDLVWGSLDDRLWFRYMRRMVNLIGYARYGSANLSSDGGSKLGFGPPSLPNNRVESNGQRRFIGGWLCASLAKEEGASMSDEDDLYKYYDRMDERHRGEEEQYKQAKRAELDAAWLRGVESRDYSEFQNKLGLGPLTGSNLGGKPPAVTNNPIGDRDWR
jgi:hypothetical protein